MCQPRISPRSPPCKFFSSFFYKCDLQGAIDFAEAAYPRKARQALHLTLTFSKLLGATPRSTSQPTTQLFLQVHSASCN